MSEDALPYSGNHRRSVSFDERALLVGGQRELSISGEIRSLRVPEEEWEKALDTAKAGRVNCIATYAFWNCTNIREIAMISATRKTSRASFRFARQRSLRDPACSPYRCSEWNYGALPPWPRDEPGVKLRTWNAPYLQRTEKYLRISSRRFSPRSPRKVDQSSSCSWRTITRTLRKDTTDRNRYLTWILKLGRKQGIDVPVVMCEGGAKGALEAFNGFSITD